jgi:hypothetical protein
MMTQLAGQPVRSLVGAFHVPFVSIVTFVSFVTFLSLCTAGCRSKEAKDPVAEPLVTLNHDKAALGSPVDVTYRFEVMPGAPAFSENYRVFVHVLDNDEKLLWTDDHDPPIPTTQWKPGQKIEYVRTMFIPVQPYIGDASIQVGLHSLTTQKRLPLAGRDASHNAYDVAKLELLPQTASVFTVFKDGWQNPEAPPNMLEWTWTSMQEATVAFKNPRKDSLFYLDLDNPSNAFPDGQQVQVKLGDQIIDRFTLQPAHQLLRKIPLSSGMLGSQDTVELKIDVDRTFVPAVLTPGASNDRRALGVRVFHAVVTPTN